jgi:hypothetical protein
LGLLFAANTGEYAFSDPQTGEGVFTRAFVDALSGAAADDYGKVTLKATIAYVKKRVPSDAISVGGAAAKQSPVGNFYGEYDSRDLVLALSQPSYITTIVEWLKAVVNARQESNDKLFRISIHGDDLAEDEKRYQDAQKASEEAGKQHEWTYVPSIGWFK